MPDGHQKLPYLGLRHSWTTVGGPNNKPGRMNEILTSQRAAPGPAGENSIEPTPPSSPFLLVDQANAGNAELKKTICNDCL